jgi:hypothetical protein
LVVFSTLVVIGLTKLEVRAATATLVPLSSILTNNFVILTETGITNAGHGSTIIGNVGNSSGTATQMNDVFCSEITGTIYGADSTYVGSGNQSCFAGAPDDNTLVGNAVGDMGAAYTAASNETPGTGDFLNAGTPAGTLNGQVLVPGVYTWDNPVNVTITGDITLLGGANDVWVFQIPGTLDIQVGKKIILSGGAQAKNIFWQVGGVVSLLGNSHFEGNILAQTQITMGDGAILTGRALSQTQVTLIGNTISDPTSLNLLKTVANNNGGTALNTAWTLTATGALGSPTNLSGSTPVNSDSTFKADTYTLSESGGPVGYTPSLYSCVKNGGAPVSGNTITLAAGDDATCTITNTDIAPSLHLLKTVANNNGGTALNTAWTLTATGATSSPTNLASTTPVNSDSTFKADTYTLSESGGPVGYTPSLYSCVKNGGAPVSGNTITLAAGDDATCTITNTDIPTFIVSGGGGGGITINNPACTDVTYNPVYSTACFDGYQYRDVISRTPAVCTLTPDQINASRQVCTVSSTASSVSTTTPVVVTPVTSTITTSTLSVITPSIQSVPKLPNTGLAPLEKSNNGSMWVLFGLFISALTSVFLVLKKNRSQS